METLFVPRRYPFYKFDGTLNDKTIELHEFEINSSLANTRERNVIAYSMTMIHAMIHDCPLHRVHKVTQRVEKRGNTRTHAHTTLHHVPLLSPQSQVLRTLPSRAPSTHHIPIPSNLHYLPICHHRLNQPPLIVLVLSPIHPPPPPLHHLLLLLFFLFSSSQRLLVRTCCSVRGPGHPAEHGCKGGPLRGERGGGVGRTLAQPPHKSHGVQGGRGAGHPSPRSAQGVRAAVCGRLQSSASGLEVAGYSEARFRQFK